MKHKICILIFVCLQTGCAVELRDRDQKPGEKPVTELVVENEYTLPVPLVASQQTVLRLDRLILKKDSVLITQGLNVRIEVDELIVENGEVRSFKADQVAAQGMNGRSGGNIEIFAQKGHGRLNLTLQGERGGRGLSGAAPDESLRGDKGADGRPYIITSDGLRVGKFENGSPGGQGKAGYQGGTGLRGGDSGTALIKVTEAEDFQVSVEKSPGQGGLGGIGGAGGLGGYGGEPSKNVDSGFITPALQKGPMGSEGPQGPNGINGPSGNVEKACLQLGEESLHCE